MGTSVGPQQAIPQVTSVPSFFKATVCQLPAAIAVTPLCAATGTIDWP